jgi:hypothetical protein
VKGKVLDKYTLNNGNLGLVVEGAGKRYHVEFKGTNTKLCLENLFGLLNDPFAGKTEQVDRLIEKGDSVELTVSYSKGPLRKAYRIHSVYPPASYRGPARCVNLTYKSGQIARYPTRI